MTFIIAKLIGLFGFLPEPLRKVAAWASLVIAAIGLLWATKAIYDASVIRGHEAKRTAATIEARDDAADERAADTIRNSEQERELIDAIDNAPKGGEIDPAAFAANCERLRRQPGGLSSAARRICGD